MVVVVGKMCHNSRPTQWGSQELEAKSRATWTVSMACVCAAVAYRGCAAWRQRRQRNSDEPAGVQCRGARCGQGGGAGRAPRPTRAESGCRGAGAATGRALGRGRRDSRMEPWGWLGAALGRGERERERAARARQARRAHRLRSARRALRTPA